MIRWKNVRLFISRDLNFKFSYFYFNEFQLTLFRNEIDAPKALITVQSRSIGAGQWLKTETPENENKNEYFIVEKEKTIDRNYV